MDPSRCTRRLHRGPARRADEGTPDDRKSRGGGNNQRTWSATAVGNPPSIDFAKYVVIAEAGEGGVCNPKILGIEAEPTGLLRLRYDPKDDVMTCIMVATRIAYVVAIPRRILPATVVFLHGYAFAVPEPPFGS